MTAKYCKPKESCCGEFLGLRMLPKRCSLMDSKYLRTLKSEEVIYKFCNQDTDCEFFVSNQYCISFNIAIDEFKSIRRKLVL